MIRWHECPFNRLKTGLDVTMGMLALAGFVDSTATDVKADTSIDPPGDT
jgi:hypothetical protein